MKKEIIREAIDRARETMNKNLGGPFGAAVIDQDGNVIAVASNSVLGDHDPTAHAEINAIREAARIKGTHDLSGFIIFATGYPCPMCLSAIILASIREVVYGCRPEDADAIGFRDDFIYHFIKTDMTDESVLRLTEEGRQECLALFREYAEQEREIY